MKRSIKYLFAISGILILCSCGRNKNVEEYPKNIILLIGDGMGVSEVYAGLTANGGSLNLEKCTVFGYSKTHSSSSYVTDSGAGGTAISSGIRTFNGAIGVGPDSLPVKTILEYAEEAGLATGLVSTSSVTHATPASFIAHQKSRNYYEAIASDFLKVDVDLVMGGGKDNFSLRADSLDLLEELKAKGYQVAESLSDIDSENFEKFYVFTANGHNTRVSEGRGDMLPQSTRIATELLDKNSKGFFLMVEGSMIDWGGHANDIKYISEEMVDFDNAIGEAIRFAESDGETLVLITADHETGGLAISGGDFETGEVQAGFTTLGHTGVMVPVFAYGPGAKYFSGIQENTDLFDKMMRLLKLGGN